MWLSFCPAYCWCFCVFDRYVRKVASAPKPVYLVDFAMAHPPDTWHMPADRFVPVNGLNTVRVPCEGPALLHVQCY